MRDLKEYTIRIINLQEKEYEYDFNLSNAYFEYFDYSDINSGACTCHLLLEKSSRLINCTISIKGKVNLTCDRSLDLFDFSVDIDKKLIFKYGKEDVELDEDVYTIAEDTEEIKFGQLLFDLIGVYLGFPQFAELLSQAVLERAAY